MEEDNAILLQGSERMKALLERCSKLKVSREEDAGGVSFLVDTGGGSQDAPLR